MPIRLTDPPQHPFPQQPQPQKPQLARVQPPMVYVFEKQRWEYKVILQRVASEEELNALGAGWYSRTVRENAVLFQARSDLGRRDR